MRRLLLAVSLLTVGVAAVSAYALAYRERAFARLLAEGEAAFAGDQTFQAIEAFSGALAWKRGSMVAHLKRGETYLKRGDLTAALRDLRMAAEIDPTAPRPLELLGDVNYALQRYARAADHYLAYTGLDDESSRVLHKLALARFRHGDALGAIDALRRIVELEPDAADAQYLLALCLRERDEAGEARRVLEQSVATAPRLLAAREELADLHQAQGRREDAVSQLEALVALDPGQQRRIDLGMAYAAAGRTEMAIAEMRRAAEEYPHGSGAYVALGRVWLTVAETRDPAAVGKALEALRAAVGGGPATSEVLALLGRALLLQGDRDQAESILRRATETFPVDPDAFVQYGEALLRRGDLAGARDALVKHHALLPRSRTRAAVERLADLSALLEDWGSAAVWLREMDADTGTADLRLRLADAQWRSGDVTGARATATRALASHPTNRGLQGLRVRIDALW